MLTESFTKKRTLEGGGVFEVLVEFDIEVEVKY